MAKAEGAAPKPVITLPQLAAKLGLDRSTLVRLEQRGKISKAPFINRPYVCRVYDADLEKKVTAEVQAYFRERAGGRDQIDAGSVTLVDKS